MAAIEDLASSSLLVEDVPPISASSFEVGTASVRRGSNGNFDASTQLCSDAAAAQSGQRPQMTMPNVGRGWQHRMGAALTAQYRLTAARQIVRSIGACRHPHGMSLPRLGIAFAQVAMIGAYSGWRRQSGATEA